MPTRIRIVYVDPVPSTRTHVAFALVSDRMFDLIATSDRVDEGLLLASKYQAHALLIAGSSDRASALAALQSKIAEVAARVRIILLESLSGAGDGPPVRSDVLAHLETRGDVLAAVRAVCTGLVEPPWDRAQTERLALTPTECDFLFELGSDPPAAELDEATQAMLPEVLAKIGLPDLKALSARSRALHRHVRSVDGIS